MEEIDYPYYSSYKDSPQISFHQENPLSNYRLITHNIDSIEKNSNISYEDSINQNNQKNIENINRTHIFLTLSSQHSNNENQKQNAPNYLQNFPNINNNNIKLEENELIENSGENNSIKENENLEKSENNTDKYQIGRWTKEEHEKFIEGILSYGNEWKKVQKIIKTRSSTQARSHAQKYFLKLKKEINSDVLSDPDKLLNYITNSISVDKLKYNNNKFTNDQKEKLMTVIRSNLKADDNNNISKSGKEGFSGEKEKEININISLNEKDESALDNIYEEDDNLAYNKKNLFNFQKKMSFDVNEIKKKPSFCSKKRKSSGDLSYNKIFNITKEMSHKNSLDVSKSNNIVQNNLPPKISAQKNNNNVNKKIKFNVKNNYIDNNNNNFATNKNINNNTNNNNTTKNKNINNNQQKENNNFNNNSNINNNNNNHPNFYIQTNFINIYNTYNNMNIKNNMNNYESLSNVYNNQNQFNQNFPNLNNELKNTVSFINITNKCNQKEFVKNDINEILNNHNFFQLNNDNKKEKKDVQDENKNIENNEQNDPFNINFGNFNTNDMKKKEAYNGEIFELGHSLTERGYNNNNIYNQE